MTAFIFFGRDPLVWFCLYLSDTRHGDARKFVDSTDGLRAGFPELRNLTREERMKGRVTSTHCLSFLYQTFIWHRQPLSPLSITMKITTCLFSSLTKIGNVFSIYSKRKCSNIVLRYVEDKV